LTTPSNPRRTRWALCAALAGLALLLAAPPASAIATNPPVMVNVHVGTGVLGTIVGPDGPSVDAHAGAGGAGICLGFTPGPWPGKVGRDDGGTTVTFPLLWLGGNAPAILDTPLPAGTGSGDAGYGTTCHDIQLFPPT